MGDAEPTILLSDSFGHKGRARIRSQLLEGTMVAIVLEEHFGHGFGGVVFCRVDKREMAEMFDDHNGAIVTMNVLRGHGNMVNANGTAVG